VTVSALEVDKLHNNGKEDIWRLVNLAWTARLLNLDHHAILARFHDLY
jgi:hypothetical protein